LTKVRVPSPAGSAIRASAASISARLVVRRAATHWDDCANGANMLLHTVLQMDRS
jgi:hypothetical protein